MEPEGMHGKHVTGQALPSAGSEGLWLDVHTSTSSSTQPSLPRLLSTEMVRYEGGTAGQSRGNASYIRLW